MFCSDGKIFLQWLFIDGKQPAKHVDEFEELQVFNVYSGVITLRYAHLGPQIERVKEDDRLLSAHDVAIVEDDFDTIQDLLFFLDRFCAALFHKFK